jgi:hypothetical protein
MVTRTYASLSLFILSIAACNVSAITPSGVGAGVPVRDGGGDGGAACDRGTVVLLSDFMSTQIALSALDGTTLSPAFLSTASTKASGLAFALSGDVAIPNVTPASGRVVLLDRYGTNVVTWADPVNAKVLAQLPVGTGFESNPQDYIELDATRAYVTRWGVNDAPGKQPFDNGNDVLVLDSSAPSITGSIAMPVEDALPPRPSGMVRVRDTVLVVLQRVSKDFSMVGESAIVGIANDAIAWEVHVTGLRGCWRPSLSPSGAVMALACEGQLAMDGSVTDLSASAIALFDVTSLPPKPLQRFAVTDQLGSPTQHQVAFASETLLLGKTQSSLGGTTDNQAFTLDVGTGKAKLLFSANKDGQGKGKGAVYGDVLCRSGCGDVCVLADADLGKLRRWNIAADGLHALGDVTVETTTGLPPMSLGGY